MTPEQKELLTNSFRTLVHSQDGAPLPESRTLLDTALRRLAPDDPAMIPLGRDIISAVMIVLEHLDRMDRAIPLLWQLGRRQADSEITEVRSQLLRQAFLETLTTRLGTEFTPETRDTWLRIFNLISDALYRAGK